jgi:hypothetical protein
MPPVRRILFRWMEMMERGSAEATFSLDGVEGFLVRGRGKK